MVRNPKTPSEPIERTRDTAVSPEKLRAPRRSLVNRNATIAAPAVTRAIVARADADFERIFGSD